MESLYDFSFELIRWLQNTYPQLEGFFSFITSLGREEFYLALFPLIYWCINKQLGKAVGYIFLTMVTVNYMLKEVLREPRPFWLEPDVGLVMEDGFGLPSGHTQFATALYLSIAYWYRRSWGWVLAILFIILMGTSRIYLGVHFVHDVLLGLLIGIITVILFIVWQRFFAPDFGKRILGQRLLAAMSIPAALGVIYAIIRLIIGEPDMSVSWSAYMADAELSGIENVFLGLGALMGLAIGLILETRDIRFRVDGSLWQRLGRYVVGMAITVLLWQGLDMVFPESPLWLALPMRALRYFIVVLWAAYFAPKLFVRINLATADPQPEMSLKL